MTIQDLILVKQEIKEIKEDNSTDIDEKNMAKIVNLRDFPKSLTDSPVTDIIITEPLDPPTNKEVTDIYDSNNNKINTNNNRQNFLSLIGKVILKKWYAEIILVINKEFSLTKVVLIDLGANMNCIQEGLIPLKYYEKSFERLTQANGEKLIINYKIPNVHICNDGICFEAVFILIKNLSSKVILGNLFMALIYPFLTKDEGIKTNVLGKDILFKFISLLIPKETYSLNNVTIIKEIDKERICQKERHLSSLKIELSLANQLIDNDIKKHRNRHIIQVLCEKELNEKNNCTTVTVSFMIYVWIDLSFGLTNIPSRPQNIINDIFTTFTVISNTYIKNVLIKEVSQLLLESPLFKTKESFSIIARIPFIQN